MNDFLKNLRSSQNKESSDPKRNLDGHFYPKTDRRKISDRRSGKSPAAPNLTALVEELIQFLPGLKDNSNLFSSLCEQVDVNAESLIEASIRRNNAVADFFENLNAMIAESGLQPMAETAGKVTTSYASGTRYTKDEVLDTMRSMRRNGATYAQIAEHLTQRQIPTFSGKGHWHAQTIHRLCR